ncbi:hypothetical protein [Fodinicurvata fenggangensis]|uniref:hypothetical protein n=1 Tax=Fodinicurvata fenggangensis TaxID=1121830 RepID=UPI0012DE6951|nr:hypothetical protein [Fodinicurvata fenggangensis]
MESISKLIRFLLSFWFITIPIAISLIFIILKESDYNCSSVEFEVQQASRCFVSLRAWEGWDRISDSIPGDGGLGIEECEQHIDRSFDAGFTDYELDNIGNWLKNEKGSVSSYWSHAKNEDFCDDNRVQDRVTKMNRGSNSE